MNARLVAVGLVMVLCVAPRAAFARLDHKALGFPTDCVLCHDPANPDWTQTRFIHDTTQFPLAGNHRNIPCEGCHTGNQFLGLPTDCYGCHWERSRDDVWKLQIGDDCGQCHDPSGWHRTQWSHGDAPANFLLQGNHASADCLTCHAEYQTRETTSACYSCHHKEYDATEHRRLGFDTACDNCHDPAMSQWDPIHFDGSAFDHGITGFALRGSHATLDCQTGCHENGSRYSGTPRDCYACHEADWTTSLHDPSHLNLDTDCQTCHDDLGWQPVRWRHDDPPANFHLEGPHATVAACTACHPNSVTANASAACDTCHTQDAPAGHFDPPCETCHFAADGDWALGRFTDFDHNTTNFPLTGLHQQVDCAGCHGGGQYAGTPTDCFTCHWTRSQDDPWRLQIGNDCGQCHNTTGWPVNVQWQHTEPPASYALEGVHGQQTCLACHANYQAQGTLATCDFCHLDKYLQTTNPDHQAVGFSTSCELCHKVTDPDWQSGVLGPDFDHSTTAFPLTGTHQQTDCALCHLNGQYANTPQDCFTCHWTRSQDDVWSLQIGNDCGQCHNTTGWPVNVQWQHTDPPASYALEGVHGQQTCLTCHPSHQAQGTSADCYACHEQDYVTAQNPNHVASSFSTTCTLCHNAADLNWQAGTFGPDFDHGATAFPLTGTHQQTDCALCHLGQYRGTPTDCFTCHWTRSQDDVWSLQIGSDCGQCHNTAGWPINIQWQHIEPPASYALQGVHGQQTCLTCHPSHQAQGTSADCYTCHEQDYVTAQNPNHVASSFSTTCTPCHDAADLNWQAGTFGPDFDHGATAFPLTGVHQQTDCALCHLDQYRGTPTDCFTCHWTRSQDDVWSLQIGSDCGQCHNTTGWPVNIQWQHIDPPASYALQGVHGQQTCLTCHPSHQAQGTSADCYACHEQDYVGAQNPNHIQSGFSADCALCHNAADATWQSGAFGPDFDHSRTTFPLTGVHQQTDCALCHLGGQWAGTPQDCFTCHWTRSQDDVWSLQIGNDCGQCHSTTAWNANINWRHTDPPASYALQGAHGQQVCLTCHPNHQAQGTSNLCVACHQADYDQTTNPNHQSAGFGTNCEVCHHEAGLNWLVSGDWQALVDHSLTAFPLRGNHQAVDCALCHLGGQYAGTPQDCFTCHWTRSQDDVWSLQIGNDCGQCHNENGWNVGVQWTHDQPPANAPLEGVHRQQLCLTCHPNHQAQGTLAACDACHLDVYQQTTNPNHVAAGFSTTCTPCHNASDATWQAGTFGPGFDHGTTAFPLTGKHQALICSQCHLNGQYAGTPQDCFTCHWTRSQDDVWSLQIGNDCGQCHTTTAWNAGVNWRHTDPPATYPLQGNHAQQLCLACHPNHQAQGTGNTCESCHLDEYQQTTNPNHVAAGFSTTCTPCHNASDATWQAGTFGPGFDHGTTAFPLTGKHQALICSQCHLNGQYTGTPQDCFTCHWTRSQDDVWSLQIGNDCGQCHTTSAWNAGVNWRHTDPPASYALQGVHAQQLCLACHPNHQAQGTSNLCVSCHQTDYDQTTNPNHVASGFSTTCTPCHNASDATWQAGTFGPGFDHGQTAFPLTGKHQALICSQCHLNGQYAGTPQDCFTCHWTRSQDDVWSLQIGSDCGQCHNTTAWNAGVNWRHTDPPASYALQGVHAQQVCLTCHSNHQAQGTSNLCVSCHQTDYDQTTNPNHTASGFSTTCTPCHNAGDATWQAGTFGPGFDHGQTAFPLTGKHQQVACALCHLNGQYGGTPQDCFTCHWTRSQDDVWRLQIGNSCGQCHNTTGWAVNIQWNHTLPPASYALQGVHAQQTCLVCHPNHQAQGTSATCDFCHLDEYQQTTNPNHVASGFSTNCVACHQASDPNWQSADLGAGFDHNQTAFPLTGAHQQVVCAQCHLGGQYAGTPQDCFTCHWTRSQDDVWSLQIGPSCGQCHNTTGWAVNIQWNHALPPASYALQGIHAQRDCLVCHPNHQAQGTANTCWGCHQTDYTGAANPPHVQPYFGQDCTVCHRAGDTAWSQGIFDHSFYRLYNQHATMDCLECHSTGYQNMPRGTCRRSCHSEWKDHRAPQPCYACHDTRRWD